MSKEYKHLRLTSLRALLIVLLSIFTVGLFSFSANAQGYTRVSGTVTDAKTGEPLPFVNVSFKGKNIGTTTDFNGVYEIHTQWASETIVVSFVGYKQQEKQVQLGEKQEIDFALEPDVQELKEFEFTVEKKRYRKKDNPAVDLIRQVIQHKDENRKEGFEYYEFEKYEKDEYDLNNFTEKWKNKGAFKNFQVLFDYIDTSDVNGKPYIPILMKEKISTVYIRQKPRAEREIVEGARISGFEQSIFSEGIAQFLEKISAPVDIYDNNIFLLDKAFTSPLSPLSPDIYRFYITDSVNIDNHKYIELSFQPRNPATIAFKGKMLVADSTQNFAVKKVELNVDSRININFLNDLKIIQDFEYKAETGWTIVKDKMIVDIQPTEKSWGIFNTKTVSYRNFKTNEPRPDDFYSGLNEFVFEDSASYRNDDYWNQNRHEELSKQEQGVYDMADTIQSIPAFNRVTKIFELLVTGYTAVGPIDIGPVMSIVSYNDIEGFRFRLGGRTNIDFHEKLRIEGYGAYGEKDQKWKYGGGLEYYFSKTPRRSLRFKYKNDIYQPGFELDWQDQDNVLLSFRRGTSNRMLYYEEASLAYDHEWTIGFMNTLELKHRIIRPTSGLTLSPNTVSSVSGNPETTESVDDITTNTITLKTRFAINEKYIQGRFKRKSIKTTAPVFYLNYTYSSPEFGSDYEFHKVYLGLEKRFKIGIIGYTDMLIEGTRIFGDVPYPLLDIARGNETFAYDDRSFNLMNFMEFGSDQSASAQFTHHFNGFLLNKIPLMKRLKWRSVGSFKMIYGDISSKNNDPENPELLQFPENFETLKAKPYMEFSAGVENIFKFFRVDAVKRLTYLDSPGVNTLWGVKGWGIRGKIQLTF